MEKNGSKVTHILQYRAASRSRWYRLIRTRYVVITAAGLGAIWLGTACGRVWIAHQRLMAAIDSNTADSNGDSHDLERNLLWIDSIGPLLKKPWRADITLYYPNGYARGRYVKIP